MAPSFGNRCLEQLSVCEERSERIRYFLPNAKHSPLLFCCDKVPHFCTRQYSFIILETCAKKTFVTSKHF